MSLYLLTDEQLMHAYIGGDVAAFDVLYVRHEGSLFRFVKRTLGSNMSAQADEVFQDCWLRIVTARASFSPALGRWKTWAFTVAHNLAMDRLRVSGREVSMSLLSDAPSDPDGVDRLDWLAPALDDQHPSTEDVTHWRAAGQQLLHCLDQLPALQRAAFLLHHEDDVSIDDMARSLGLGFETVKSRLRYALQKLRGCMQPYLAVWEVA